MNLALLIGIDKYDRLTALPACANDLVLMQETLKATNKYQAIEIISNARAEEAKGKLRDFFSSHSNSAEIEEIFIYFTGHGGYQDDALFCCTDFDEKRAATTSISNTELDDLLRNASPKVAVKVIDACQSGAPYIKDSSNSFLKSIQTSRLSSFVCMASSQHDQNSYASITTSHFTAAWVKAALSRSTGTILYRDIQAALADSFASTNNQTPFFVNQGSGLEAFSIVTDEMVELFTARNNTTMASATGKSIEAILKQEISKSDLRFIDYNEAVEAINTSNSLLKNTEISQTLIKDFYSKSVNSDLRLAHLPKTRHFAEFGQKQGWDKKYFIQIEQETYSAPSDNPINILHGREVTVQKTRPSYINATESLPVEAFEISLNSNNPSLPSYRCYIGIIHSNTDVMILSATASLTQKGWDKKVLEQSEIKWEYHAISWQTVIQTPSVIWERGLGHALEIIKTHLDNIVKQSLDG